MSKDNGQGIFSMTFIASIQNQPLMLARELAVGQVNASSARQTNKDKAMKAIGLAKNTNGLLLALSNFSLSHQGLKVLR